MVQLIAASKEDLQTIWKMQVEANLEEDGFFRTNLAEQYSSTFPPTTVAATTSIMSGKMPNEHSWLGWDCYYPQVDKNITVFFNVLQGTEEQAESYNVPYRYTGYENIFTRFQNAGKTAYIVASFLEPYPNEFGQITKRVKELCDEDGRKEQFVEEFQRLFGEEFVLMTKQEVIESGLFGTGKEHECFQGMLGDYLAVAVSDLSIYNTKEEAEHFIGVHAGLSPEEMTIPLILVERKN